MTQEITLPIETNGEYKNVQLKPKWDKKTLKFEGGVQEGQSAKFEKVFLEGRPISSTKYTNKDGSPSVSYSSRAKDANGVEVSFWLTEAEHQQFVALGDKGTKFTVTTAKETIVNTATGAEIPRYRLILTKD
jgi:hypothetical protein